MALYVGVKQETPTDLLLDAAWTAGRVVWLPRVRHGQPGCMDFALCSGPQDLRPGPFGLREPTPALPGLGPEALGAAFSPDLFILPGLLFDLRGGAWATAAAITTVFCADARPARSWACAFPARWCPPCPWTPGTKGWTTFVPNEACSV